MTDLPAPVRAALGATNERDLARFVAAFADDGVIDEWGRKFRGHVQIEAWSRRESIGMRQTFSILDIREGEDDSEVIVIVDVSGGGFNGRSTFRFRLAPDGETLERITISQ